MASTAYLTPLWNTEMESHTAHSRNAEWKHSCLLALGVVTAPWGEAIEDPPLREDPNAPLFLNLARSDLTEELEDDSTLSRTADPWMETALEIHKNMNRMEAWIDDVQADFVSVEMVNEEASLIQSTVTSYTATTANEVETLRSMIVLAKDGSVRGHWQHHQNGIVQILLDRLKHIAKFFGVLQQQRNRSAVWLWQDPLACKLVATVATESSPQDNHLDEVLGLSSPSTHPGAVMSQRERRFLPTRPSHLLQRNLLDSYQQHEKRVRAATLQTQRPKSMFGAVKRARPVSTLDASQTSPSQQTTPTSTKRSKLGHLKELESMETEPWTKISAMVVSQDDPDLNQQYEQENQVALQQEAVLLKAKVENDLDAVQAMEQSMVDITALLSQFSELVASQQENVWNIHDATATTKENMEQGQEELVDATARTKASRHWTATGITAMGLILLIFHWIRP